VSHSSHPPWFDHHNNMKRSWGSSVSIETKLWAGWPGFNSWQGQWWKFYPSPPHTDQLWCPSNLLSNGYRQVVSLGG
jgi:hypothetical protein